MTEFRGIGPASVIIDEFDETFMMRYRRRQQLWSHTLPDPRIAEAVEDMIAGVRNRKPKPPIKDATW